MGISVGTVLIALIDVRRSSLKVGSFVSWVWTWARMEKALGTCAFIFLLLFGVVSLTFLLLW